MQNDRSGKQGSKRKRGRRARLTFAIAMAAAAGTLLAACGSGGSPSSSSGGAASLTTINIGVVPFSGLAATGLGQVAGIYAHYGLKVNLKPAKNVDLILANLTNGSEQIGYSSTAILLNAVEKGVGVRCVAPVENANTTIPSYPASELIVAKNNPITSPAQLAGKTIAVPTLSGIDDMLARAAVVKAGGNWSAVHVTEISFPEMNAAIASGEIAAAVQVEPFTNQGEASGKIRGLEDLDSFIGHDTGQCFVATNSFIKNDKAVLTRFVEAQDQAILYAKAHPSKANAQIARVSGLPQAEAKSLVPPRVIYGDDLAPSTFVDYENFLSKYGGLEGPVRPASNFVWIAPGTPMTKLLFNASGKYTG